MQAAGAKVSGRRMVEYFLIGMLCFTCSLPFKVNVSNFSVFPVAVAAFVYLAWRIAIRTSARTPSPRWERLLATGFVTAAVTCAVIWIFAANWRDRTDLLWGWILAAGVFVALLDAAHQKDISGRVLAILFIVCSLPNAMDGLSQHFLVTAGRTKDWSGWSGRASNIPVTGFFGFANEMAVFQYWPVLLSIGLALHFKRWTRFLFIALAILHSIVLYESMSRATILTAAGALGVLAILLWIRNRKIFLALSGVGSILLAGAGAWVVFQLPHKVISGRLNLWEKTFDLIYRGPFGLPAGYIGDAPVKFSVFWVPHNVFLYLWVFLGWIGFLLALGLVIFLAIDLWKNYPILHKNPFAASLLIGLGAILAVNGMVTLYLHEVFHLITFSIILSIWAMARREMLESAVDAE
jgi:hypothetical protein